MEEKVVKMNITAILKMRNLCSVRAGSIRTCMRYRNVHD